MTPHTPTPALLMTAPEMASLALLEHALHITVPALLAVHPDLDHAEPFGPQPYIAGVIVRAAECLLEQLAAYRRAVGSPDSG